MEEIKYSVGNSNNNSWSNCFKLNTFENNIVHFGLCINRKEEIVSISSNSLSYLLISQEIAQSVQKILNKKNWQLNLGSSLKELFKNYSEYEISSSIVYLDNNNLLIVNYGNINAFLKREEKVVQLTLGEKGKIIQAKGILIDKDEIVITNSKSGVNVVKEDLLASEIFIKFEQKEKFDFVVHNYQEEEEEKIKEENYQNNKNIFSKLNFRKNNLRPKIAIKEDTIDLDSRRKKALTPLFGLVLLILLIISITIGVNKKKKEEKAKDISKKITEIQDLISGAKGFSDSSQARAYLLDAKNKANELILTYPDDSEVIDIQNAVNLSFSQIAGIIEKNANMYLDLGLIASNFKGDGMAMSSDYLAIFDNNEKRIVSIEIENKKTKTVSNSDLIPSVLGISVYDERIFVQSRDGIREVTNSVELFIKSDDWNSENIIFKLFAGNIYIIDKINNKIYRYIGVRGGFLEKEDWLAPGITADFKDAIDMAIDGSIWILYSDGDVWAYLQGAPQKLNINYPESISKNLKFYTDENYEEFYVLDSDNGRIFEFSKNGEYKKEYLSNDLRQAQSFVVSQKTQKIIFLKDSKLWEIDMQ